MKYLIDFKIFEKSEEKTKTQKMIEDFEKDFDTELDPKFEISQIKLLRKAFSHFNKNFLKNKIDKITLEDLGATHGRWKETEKKKEMFLNPSTFDLKKDFANDIGDIPYKEFVIVHEIGHCIDHIEKVSYSKKWQSISGWKKCERDEKIPDGYKRYIERRLGKGKEGKKKSNWIYKEDAKFCRKYSSKTPREDFADSFAFAVFKNYKRFGSSPECKEKLEIVKKILCEIN